MNQDEIMQVFSMIGEADFTKWSFEDLLIAYAVISAFANTMKPLLLKNEVSNPTNSTFLFKM